MSKSNIIEDVINPLLKHLERAEEENNSDPEVKKIFGEIKSKVKHKKDILDETKVWESNLTGCFGVMERHIDNILEDKECKTTTELEAILSDVNSMEERLIPPEKLQLWSNKKLHTWSSVVRPPSSIYEIGESSNTDKADEQDEIEDTSLSFIDEIIESPDPQLRYSLYCLSIFPENSVIKRRSLVYLWMGLNVLCPEKGKTLEQVGEIFFDDLVNKGILIPHMMKNHNGVVDQCMVQPIFFKRLFLFARRTRFILDSDENNKDSSLQVYSIPQNKENVYTIFNVNQKYLKSDIISKHGVINMAVMQLGQWRCVDPHHIEVDKTDFLKDLGPTLTYLSLQGISRLPELPEPIGNSTSLMILDLRTCHNLEKLPPKIKSWKSLTHLDVSMCYLLDHIPRWIGTLNNLEVFKGFVIGSLRNKNRCRLSDISDLHKLRKLSISIGRESEVTAEESNSLKDLSNLRSLTLTWATNAKEHQAEKLPTEEEQKITITTPEKLPYEQQKKRVRTVPVNFSPPKNLDKLDLRCFPFPEPPQWLTPTELKKINRLYIRGGMLAHVGGNNPDGAWAVKILRLRFLKNFEIEWNDLRGLFPEIKCVEHLKCEKLKNFPESGNGCWFQVRDESFPCRRIA